jgi:GNAT superfamily N-acetyltransferase
MARLPVSPVDGLRVIELDATHESLLQRFFDANPEYFLAVNGEPAGPREAFEEIHGELPVGWSYTKNWLIGYLDASGELAAMANVTSDLLAAGVWHIGLFIVQTSRHGNGDARLLYRSLEDWAESLGAEWLRLGVVEGNGRAERFWTSCGFVQTRTRHGVPMGRRVNTLRVMSKPLQGGSLDDYLQRVARDRPEPAAA